MTVEAPTVVVACGAIESPALLLRSGIGGPAAGKHLRLHPAFAVMGVYDEPIEGWNGQIQSALSDHFFEIEDGLRLPHRGDERPAGAARRVVAVGSTERRHKELMQTLRWQAPFITVARDHGSGEVVLDDHGRAVVRWDFDDAVDRRLARRANVELARLHHAAGAQRIFTLHAAPMIWSAGRRLRCLPRARSTRRATSPTTSPASPRTRWARAGWARIRRRRSPTGAASCTTSSGVWIGDGSRVPDRPGREPDGDDHVARPPDGGPHPVGGSPPPCEPGFRPRVGAAPMV